MTAAADGQLAFAGPGVLADLVRRRELTPRELVELFLARIEAIDPKLNAFRVTMAEEALAAADAMSSPEGLLAGVPIAIKDDMPVAGQSVTRGSRSYRPPERADGEVVRRLRAAGAIPIGITNVPELMIFPWTASDANGVTRNPWDPTRTPGGSSGGSAAAVAAGLVPCATGSDGGGSIRIPAACCGLVGMKPSRGRVSTQPAREGWLGLSVFGALARTVGDSALLLDAIHGSMPGDADEAPPFEGRYVEAAATPPGRLRIAISRKLPPGSIARLSSDQRGAWERTGAVLCRARARGDRARPGLRPRRARVHADVDAGHLRGVALRCPTARGSSARRDSSSAPAAVWCRLAGATGCSPGERAGPRACSTCGTRSTCC